MQKGMVEDGRGGGHEGRCGKGMGHKKTEEKPDRRAGKFFSGENDEERLRKGNLASTGEEEGEKPENERQKGGMFLN